MTSQNTAPLLPSIVFFQVASPQDKLKKLCAVAWEHFNQKERLLILAPDLKARNFVDELLWRLPLESFLPHLATDMPCQEFIVITTSLDNLNDAPYLFNLRPTPLPISSTEKKWSLEGIKKIYEFDELSPPEKRASCETRYRAYKEAGYPISSLTT